MPNTPAVRRNSTTETWMASLRQQRVPTQLGQLNIWSGGQPNGPAMVFWPSLLVDSSMWRYQFDHFAPTHRVVLIDPPGAGKSDALHGTFDLTECCNCLIEVLDAFGIDRCRFIGTSWGALVGSVFAALYPQRLECAVLINGSATPPAAQEVAAMTELAAGLDGMDSMPDWLVGATQAAFAGPTAEAGNPGFMDYLRCVLNEHPKSVAFAIRSVVVGSKDRHGLLGGIKDVPILVLAGAEDRRFSVDEAGKMAAAITGSQFAVLPRTGHLAARESPSAVNERIDALLAGLAR